MVSCNECKGRLLCGLKKCPLLERLNAKRENKPRKEVVGESPPNVFVGWRGYPFVNVGPSVSMEGAATDASQWYGLPLEEIVSRASGMARGFKKHGVKKRLARELLEAGLSAKGVDMAVTFEKTPRQDVRFFDVSQPGGPSGKAKAIEVQGNARIPCLVDEAVDDGWTAKEALAELMHKDYDYYYLQKVLTSGALGQHSKKRLVPTRWAITATDTILADEHLKRVRQSETIACYQVYSNEYLSNRFEIILLPGNWEYEQFEAWSPRSFWGRGEANVSQEFEPYRGRKDYAKSQGGGYYAARFAVAEAMAKRNVQARALVIREIYDGYRVPVGVWQVRENARAALSSKPNEFNSLEEAVGDASSRLKNRWGAYCSRSTLLRQKKLWDY